MDMVKKIFFQTTKIHLIIIMVLMTPNVRSGEVIPGHDLTAFEWTSWPDYCRAAIAASHWSGANPFSRTLLQSSRSWVIEFRKTHTERIGIPGAHHFCMGMVYINRARRLGTDRSIKLMDQAVSEIAYSYSTVEKRAPFYSVLTAYFGVALYHSGQKEKAFEIWKDGIETQPYRSESYVAMAEALRSEHKMKEALELLLKFDRIKREPVAEVEYFIGHTYFDLGLYNEAKKHADNAYRLGYPLPGLKNKLRRVGK